MKFSTLYRYIKDEKRYVGISKIPQSSCLCPTCENTELLCQGITKANVSMPGSCHDLMEKFCCLPITKECAHGDCKKCPSLDEKIKEITDIDSINYYFWESGSRYQEKKLKEAPGKNVAAKLKTLVQTLKLHYYNKRTQTAKYKKQIENLKEDEAVIQVDFSENYKIKQQGEIKAAYYVYTCCVYINKDGTVAVQNLTYVTRENDHSGVVSFRLNERILKKVIEKLNGRIKIVYFWSDRCASQIRIQYAFYFLNLYDKTSCLSWNFFEVNHGKGAADGVGGTVKHRVYREVLAGRLVIEGPEDFATNADRLLDSIDVIYVAEMDLTIDELSRKNTQYVHDTLKVHKITRKFSDDNTCSNLMFFHTTEDSQPFATKQFQLEASKPKLKEGMFVVVRYEGKPYPGKVMEVKDDSAVVKCIDPCGRSKWKWPSPDDILDYSDQDILCVINPPQLSKSPNFRPSAMKFLR